jgi:hypothetical protein
MKQWSEINAPSGLYERIMSGLEDPTSKSPSTITYTGTCPVAVGDEVSLKRSKAVDVEYQHSAMVPSVWIRITNIVRGKKGEHVASFVVADHRPRYLAPGGGVTTSAAASIDAEADYDPDYAEQQAIRARLSAAETNTDRDAAYRSFRERLKDTRRAIGPFADVVLLAELSRILDRASSGDLGG